MRLPLRRAVCAVLNCFVLLVTPFGAQTKSACTWQWRTFNPEGLFSVFLPCAPEVVKKDVTAADPQSFYLRSYVVQLHPGALQVEILSDDNRQGEATEARLRRQMAREVESLTGNVTREKRINLDGFPGLECEIQGKSSDFTVRIYLVNSMVYRTLVMRPLDAPYPDTERFLDSFRILAPDVTSNPNKDKPANSGASTRLN